MQAVNQPKEAHYRRNLAVAFEEVA